ncbi:MAG: hypothetical protein JXR83_13285 [Deltaproteobacteria bacterium]|nr:hypothetical protein [Deltaproteobacteria bacterium]
MQRRPRASQRLAWLAAWPLALAAVACPAPVERRAVDVGAWPIDQTSGSAPTSFVVGDLEIQLDATASCSWGAGQASRTSEVEATASERFYARGDGQFGATRSLGLGGEGRGYRSLYLARSDSALCFALPMADAMRWTVPSAEMETAAGAALIDCDWDVSGIRLHARTDGPALLEWTLDVSTTVVHATPVVDGEALLIDLRTDLRPGPQGLRIVARDAGGNEIGSWPGAGSGRLLLLPALLDAVDDDIDFIRDGDADFEAPLAVDDKLIEVAARFTGPSGELHLSVTVADASVDAGDPIDVPALNAIDTIAVMLLAEVPDAPLVRAAIGRNGALSSGSTAGISAACEGSDPWHTQLTVDTTALSADPLGKGDIVRLCLHAYLDGGAAPRRASAVWPAGCDADSTRWAAIRLFSIAH